MNSNKEVGQKKHILRRTFFGAAIVAGIAFAGSIIATAAALPSMLLSAVGAGVGTLSAVVGAGAGINLAHAKIQEKRLSKKARESLKEISELDASKSSTMSEEAKVKLVKSHAKTEMKLGKLIGVPGTGVYRSNSGLTEKQNEKLNRERNEDLLVDIKNYESEKKGKSKIAKYKIRKSLSSECVRNRMQVYTKEYKNVVPGVAIKDPRIEISCLCKSTAEKFEKLVEDIPPTDELGSMIRVSFEGTNPIKQSYARITDYRYTQTARELLLNDIASACSNCTPEQVNTYFPISVEVRNLDEKARSTIVQTTRIKSFTDLIMELNAIKAGRGDSSTR